MLVESDVSCPQSRDFIKNKTTGHTSEAGTGTFPNICVHPGLFQGSCDLIFSFPCRPSFVLFPMAIVLSVDFRSLIVPLLSSNFTYNRTITDIISPCFKLFQACNRHSNQV